MIAAYDAARGGSRMTVLAPNGFTNPVDEAMLRDVYTQFGSSGTLLIAGLLVLTIITWVQAVAGVVVSELPSTLKAVIVAVISLIPPLGIVVMAVSLAATPGLKEDRPVRRATLRALPVSKTQHVSETGRVRSDVSYADVA